jgi:hypothetical protein
MDIRIDGLHEKALIRLMERNNEKTGVGMARILIRDAAKEAGLWPVMASEQEDTLVESTANLAAETA